MGWFGRDRKRASQAVLSASPVELAQIGLAAYGGDSPYPAGVQLAALDQYVVTALESAGWPASGTPEHRELQRCFLEELVSAAEQSAPWGFVGAFSIATNFFTDDQWAAPRLVELMDRVLTTLRDDGVAYTAVPPFALQHWEAIHGNEGLGPAHWPSALEPLTVPGFGDEPVTIDLAEDEWRRLACDGPGENARTTYAHKSPEGQVVATVDGVDMSDGVRKRWDLGVRAGTYTSFLRELGDRLITRPWWAHDDLEPYFPCRLRSRDEMRAAAREFRT